MTRIIEPTTGRNRGGSMWKRVLGIPGRVRTAFRISRERHLLLEMPPSVYRDIAMPRADIIFGVSGGRRFIRKD